MNTYTKPDIQKEFMALIEHRRYDEDFGAIKVTIDHHEGSWQKVYDMLTVDIIRLAITQMGLQNRYSTDAIIADYIEVPTGVVYVLKTRDRIV
jgi:hypothetical protein